MDNKDTGVALPTPPLLNFTGSNCKVWFSRSGRFQENIPEPPITEDPRPNAAEDPYSYRQPED